MQQISTNPNVSNWQVSADLAWEAACRRRREAERVIREELWTVPPCRYGEHEETEGRYEEDMGMELTKQRIGRGRNYNVLLNGIAIGRTGPYSPRPGMFFGEVTDPQDDAHFTFLPNAYRSHEEAMAAVAAEYERLENHAAAEAEVTETCSFGKPWSLHPCKPGTETPQCYCDGFYEGEGEHDETLARFEAGWED